MPITVITVMNDRLDKICYDHYGSTANRQVEQVIDANPGLEEQGILLPEGISILLPDLTVTAPTTSVIKTFLFGS